MVIKEFYKTRNDGVNLYRNYSNENFRILQEQTGEIYDEAIDVEDAPYTYIETNEKIEAEQATEQDYLDALAKLGVSE